MEMTGSQRIEAPRELVWRGLNNPDILKQCIPACQELEWISPTELAAKVVFRVGPLKVSILGKVTLSKLDPPAGYTIRGEGQGGIAGLARGGATVRLEADGEAATILHYDAMAEMGGKVAQLGARLFDGTARKVLGDFFERFGRAVMAAGSSRV